MLDRTPAMPTAISVSTRVKPRLARRPSPRDRERGDACMSVSFAVQQARQPGTPAGVQERTRPMTLTTWCTARPPASTRRRVPVGVLVPCIGSKAIEATLARTLDPVGGAEDDGLDLDRAAGADCGGSVAAAALRRQAGVHDPAGAAGRVVEADADRLVARDRFGAHELDVGGERVGGGVEAAAVDEARPGWAPRRWRRPRSRRRRPSPRSARSRVACASAERDVLRVHAKHCRNPRRNSRSRG